MPDDADPTETREWLEALDSVLTFEGADRAFFLLDEVTSEARRKVPYSATTAYLNTIPPGKEDRLVRQGLLRPGPVASPALHSAGHGALAICAVTAALLRGRTDTQASPPVRPDQPPPADPGMIPLTVPETARLLSEATPMHRPPGHKERWANWPRRHQAGARWHHQRTRLARDSAIALVS